MKSLGALVGAATAAALVPVVLGYFAKDPARGVNTGFGSREIALFAAVVFFGVYMTITQRLGRK